MKKHDPWIVHNMHPKSIKTEISIIKKSNEHGFQSWGWHDGTNKIILKSFENGYNTKKEIKHVVNMATVIANALNKEGL